MAQFLLVLLARSTAERPADLLRAAVDEASLEAAELAPAASDARPSRPSLTPLPLPPNRWDPTAARAASAASAAAKAIASAAKDAAEGASAALKDVGVAGVPDATPSGTPSLGLSEEVAALVKAARAKEWRPDPKAEISAERGDQSAFLRREAHRRWQNYFKMAANRLEAPRTGDAVEEYHLLYEVINQIIAGLQLAADASQGRGSELSRGFAHVSQLLRVLEHRSRGTAFENEDFLHQAYATASLGCGNRPFEDRFCDRAQLQRWLRANDTSLDRSEEVAEFEDSWLKYLDLGFAKGLWRKLSDQSQTFNPSEDEEKRSLWQLFPTYIMAKDLRQMFSSSGPVCRACRHLTAVVLEKYHQFRAANFADPSKPDEVNNAFFTWQLTHHAEQSAEKGQAFWPELYGDATFRQLKSLVKTSCVEYLQEIYSSTFSSSDFDSLELSIWASVTSPAAESMMGLAFHDHPLSLLSGVFYADAGGDTLRDRTPTVFADPRGTAAFRYAAAGRWEPVAPFHRLAYSHARTGLSLVFPSWLVHGVAPHHGPRERVVFAYNLHTSPGSTLASWARTTL